MLSLLILYRFADHGSRGTHGHDRGQGPVSRKSRKLFGPEKPFVKLRPAYSVKLVFSYLVKRIKTKITAKFRASRCFRFEDTKRVMSSEIEKQAQGRIPLTLPSHRILEILNDT